MQAQVNVVGNQRHLVSIALQKEASATLVRTKQGSMLLPHACIQGAIKPKALLIFNSIRVAMATDALTCRRFHNREPPISFNPEPVTQCEPSLNLIKASKAGEGLVDTHSAI